MLIKQGGDPSFCQGSLEVKSTKKLVQGAVDVMKQADNVAGLDLNSKVGTIFGVPDQWIKLNPELTLESPGLRSASVQFKGLRGTFKEKADLGASSLNAELLDRREVFNYNMDEDSTFIVDPSNDVKATVNDFSYGFGSGSFFSYRRDENNNEISLASEATIS